MTRLKRKKVLDSTEGNDIRFGTPVEVAAYRAKRMSGYDTIIEVGAGAGFQTAEFAKFSDVIAIEVDEARMKRGTFQKNVKRILGDALDPQTLAQVQPKGTVAVFLDPERPANARERTLSEIKPDIKKFLASYTSFSSDIAIELPPFLKELPEHCEREYLSIDGKLNRLTIYFGALCHADISIVQLPEEKRFSHTGPIPPPHNTPVDPLFLLEPDAALQHAGLAHLALNTPYQQIIIGKKAFYLTERKNDFFRNYKLAAKGKRDVEHRLAKCGTLILHGVMSADEQRTLLRTLNPFCKGKTRMHLFLADDWYLTTQA